MTASGTPCSPLANGLPGMACIKKKQAVIKMTMVMTPDKIRLAIYLPTRRPPFEKNMKAKAGFERSSKTLRIIRIPNHMGLL